MNQSWIVGTIFCEIYSSQRVKTIILLIWKVFREINISWYYVHSVEKYNKTQSGSKIREINTLLTSFEKMLIWRKKCLFFRKNKAGRHSFSRIFFHKYFLELMNVISRNFENLPKEIFSLFFREIKSTKYLRWMIHRPISNVIQLQNETIYKQSKDEIDLKFMVLIENNLFENCFTIF